MKADKLNKPYYRTQVHLSTSYRNVSEIIVMSKTRKIFQTKEQERRQQRTQQIFVDGELMKCGKLFSRAEGA